MFELKVKTNRRMEVKEITEEVKRIVIGKEGRLIHLYTPHTTCGLIINEDADPNVTIDIMEGLERLAPKDYRYRHTEGNADAHVKATITGCSVTLPFKDGTPLLGRWQGIFLLEFDGPRERRVIVTIL
jgi:secondary thiamine-phosphate synthase enzyme